MGPGPREAASGRRVSTTSAGSAASAHPPLVPWGGRVSPAHAMVLAPEAFEGVASLQVAFYS